MSYFVYAGKFLNYLFYVQTYGSGIVCDLRVHILYRLLSTHYD